MVVHYNEPHNEGLQLQYLYSAQASCYVYRVLFVSGAGGRQQIFKFDANTTVHLCTLTLETVKHTRGVVGDYGTS